MKKTFVPLNDKLYMDNADKFTEKDKQNVVFIASIAVIIAAAAFVISLFGFWGAIGFICLFITYKMFIA